MSVWPNVLNAWCQTFFLNLKKVQTYSAPAHLHQLWPERRGLELAPGFQLAFLLMRFPNFLFFLLMRLCDAPPLTPLCESASGRDEAGFRTGDLRRAASSLRNKRPGLSGRPPCKGVAIGVARRGARLGGERTLRTPPPPCSDPVSHAGGPHVASFVVGRSCACVRARACVRVRARKQPAKKRGWEP